MCLWGGLANSHPSSAIDTAPSPTPRIHWKHSGFARQIHQQTLCPESPRLMTFQLLTIGSQTVEILETAVLKIAATSALSLSLGFSPATHEFSGIMNCGSVDSIP